MHLRNTIPYLLASLLAFPSLAQDGLEDFQRFNHERHTITRNSMVALGGWGIGNMIAGGVGMAVTPWGSQANYFHQMNLYWNAVNVGIAIPAYIKARKSIRLGESDIGRTFKEQRSTETIYLVNMALDVAYVGTGLWMSTYSPRVPVAAQPMLSGFGHSMMIQGGFLLVFDTVILILHRRHWNRSSPALFNHLKFNGTGVTIQVPEGRRKRTPRE